MGDEEKDSSTQVAVDDERSRTPPSPPAPSTSAPLISLRGKTKLVPVPLSSVPLPPPSSSGIGKFVRAPKAEINRLPLPSGAAPYAPSSAATRVSYNGRARG